MFEMCFHILDLFTYFCAYEWLLGEVVYRGKLVEQVWFIFKLTNLVIFEKVV